MVGDEIKPFDSGKSAFRFMIPRQQILDNSVTQKLANREGYMTMWIGNDRRIIMYPCSNNTLMNCVAIHARSLSASKGVGESPAHTPLLAQLFANRDDPGFVGWSRVGSKESLLDIYSDFGPLVQSLLEMVEASTLKVWTLLDMERISSWTKGRLALLGDAAHPFLPHQGQGG